MDRFRRGPRLRLAIVSYATDWMITCVLWWILKYITHNVSGYKRHFSLADPSLRYPHVAGQRVSSNALWFLSAALPLCVQVVVNVLFTRSWWDLHHSALGLWLSITVTGSITQLVKVTVGRPRPDLIARCQPLADAKDPLWGLSTIDICTQTSKHTLENGWRSFPSGHSSMAFAGLGFLTFYLAGKLHVFNTRGYAGKVWLLLVPLAVASWIALSRTMDYRHHWHDVLAGSALGLGVAYFSYRQYFPHLASEEAHMPFTTRFDTAALDLDIGTTEFRDNADNEEEVGLVAGSRQLARFDQS